MKKVLFALVALFVVACESPTSSIQSIEGGALSKEGRFDFCFDSTSLFASPQDDTQMDYVKFSISRLSPISGPIGTKVTIWGSGFLSRKTTVFFGGVEASSKIHENDIEIYVPKELPTGATTIKVVRGYETKVVQFIIEDPIVGSWMSEGDTIIFKADGSYIRHPSWKNGNFWETKLSAGTYVTTFRDSHREIRLQQGIPIPIYFQGIYDVTIKNNSLRNLKIEYVQTEPNIGLSIPTSFSSNANEYVNF